jgi:hypothetical protein
VSPFNPESPESRRELGAALLGTLTTKGFKLDPIRPGTERVARWDQNMPSGMVVAIYTTVEGDGASATVRGVGEDAIRVVLLYTAADGTERGLATATRVHRTGQIPAIVERLSPSRSMSGRRTPPCPSGRSSHDPELQHLRRCPG